ncbi:AAA family ATPase [Bradyrhizobium elkanii]|uniref:AAA family ATPase n=1 Tax=Bradyrhizobium elkanii TaxID=29448 RepID=UPI00144A09C2|nr:helicase RepA family protein [Bradyrhizobium elkanii]MCS3577661.1 hypothetical protein [Bradyrhizobium elkanii]MCS3720536.1 hypothetical protein [Bradyrhizobium elkanii]MCS4004953.1 hypothetical protein [Bradyrhizobium elkanii USDA 61]BBC00110.1 regulatory protein RepA [Bradyrhizobium elkanii USDA 61]
MLATPKITAQPYRWIDPSRIPQRQWIYGRSLIRRFLSSTVAPGGVGKSTLALADAVAMATGRDLLGVKPAAPLRVWYWNFEDPLEEIERRVAAIMLHYRLTEEDVGGRLYINSGRDTPITMVRETAQGLQIDSDTLSRLRNQIEELEIDVLMLDPFVATHGVSENDNAKINLVLQLWAKLADLTDIAIDVTHHVRKGQSGQGSFTTDDGRGASAFRDAVRSSRVLNPMTKEEGEKIGIDNPRAYFRCENGKANLAPPPDKATWYHLKSVSLGNGDPNDPEGGDHVAIVTPWQWPDPLAGMTGADFERVAAVIKRGKWRENSQASAWVGRAVGEALDLNVDNKADKAKIASMLKIWLASGSLIIVEGQDEKRETRKFVEVAE